MSCSNRCDQGRNCNCSTDLTTYERVLTAVYFAAFVTLILSVFVWSPT